MKVVQFTIDSGNTTKYIHTDDVFGNKEYDLTSIHVSHGAPFEYLELHIGGNVAFSWTEPIPINANLLMLPIQLHLLKSCNITLKMKLKDIQSSDPVNIQLTLELPRHRFLSYDGKGTSGFIKDGSLFNFYQI